MNENSLIINIKFEKILLKYGLSNEDKRRRMNVFFRNHNGGEMFH